MFNQDNKMHPEDQRNLIIFAAISIILFFAYDHFVIKPQVAAEMSARKAQAIAEQNMPETEREEYTEKPRPEVLAKETRLAIENEEIVGTLRLKGGRIDDLSLKQYFETIEQDENVHVLNPAGSAYARYAELGWVTKDKTIRTPDKDTIWQIKDGSSQVLSQDNPVTLIWDNGQGLSFERTFTLDAHYMLSITQRVINRSGKDVSLAPYALVMQHGLPSDFKGRVVVQEGPIAVIGDKLEDRTFNKMQKKPRFTQSAAQGWAGITDKYWLTAIIPQQGNQATYRFSHIPSKIQNGKERYQVDITGASQNIASDTSAENTVHIFAGAKEVSLLKEYRENLSIPNFHLAVDFGMFWFLTEPFFMLLHFLYTWVGHFGIALIIFTIAVRAAVFPLANTSFRSFAKMKQVGPQMTELREKYAGDKQKLQEEIVKLYQREKVNPAAGCLPILIQIPIFFALYKVLSISIEMRHQPFFGWIKDMSEPDPTTVFNLFGLIPWSPPDFLMIGAWPCIMLVSMILQRKLSPPPQDELQAKMIAAMPFIMTFVLAQFASGLVIYWTISNLLSVVQQYIIMKRMGVEPHLFSKDKDRKETEEAVKKGPAVHPGLEMIEDEVEEALETVVSPPKPKKSKKKK